MDLFQLTYFIEVAHKKSFTKASHSLHISQPSISKGIKALENYWQVQLFNRTGKHVELTEIGAYLLPKVESVIDQLAQISDELGSPHQFRHRFHRCTAYDRLYLYISVYPSFF